MGYLRFWWFSVFALAAIGLSELVGALGRWPALGIWSAVWLAVAGYGVADNKLAVYYTAAIMLAAVWAGFILARREPRFNGRDPAHGLPARRPDPAWHLSVAQDPATWSGR